MMNNTTVAPRWDSLEKFTVEIATGSDSLFANGRQQVGLRVAVQALSVNNDPVELSEKEKLSLCLVHFNGGREIPYEPKINDQIKDRKLEWEFSINQNNKFEFYTAGAGPRASLAGRRSDNFTKYSELYVRTFARAPLRIAARITRDDGTFFYSRDRSDGSVTLIPVKPRTYRVSDYQFQRVDMSRGLPVRGEKRDYYVFGLFDGATRIDFVEFSMAPASLILQEFPHERIGGYITGYSDPGESSVRYHFSSPYFHNRLEADYVRPGQVVVVWLSISGTDNRNAMKDWGGAESRTSKITAVDTYGNTHNLGLKFSGDGKGGIELF